MTIIVGNSGYILGVSVDVKLKAIIGMLESNLTDMLSSIPLDVSGGTIHTNRQIRMPVRHYHYYSTLNMIPFDFTNILNIVIEQSDNASLEYFCGIS